MMPRTFQPQTPAIMISLLPSLVLMDSLAGKSRVGLSPKLYSSVITSLYLDRYNITSGA